MKYFSVAFFVLEVLADAVPPVHVKMTIGCSIMRQPKVVRGNPRRHAVGPDGNLSQNVSPVLPEPPFYSVLRDHTPSSTYYCAYLIDLPV